MPCAGEVQTERAETGPDPAPFVSHTFYDGLGRVTATVSPTGAATRLLYDSRSNLVRRYDAQASRGTATASSLDRYGEHDFSLGDPAITAPGNVTEYTYDGLSRRTRTSYVLTADGTGDTDEVDRIEVEEEWDDAGLRIAMTDDNGHRTRYDHDGQGRLFRTVYADGTAITLTFDGAGRVTRTVDANGTVVVPSYDAADRLTGRTITPGAGVSLQTTSESFSYDGLSRLLTASDNDSTVTLVFDSLSNAVSETLSGNPSGTVIPIGVSYPVARTFDSLGNRRTLIYPGTTLTLAYAVDSLDRVASISDGAGLVASYDYVGPNLRILDRVHGNGSRIAATYDGARRPLIWSNSTPAGGDLGTFSVRWDPMSNRRIERHSLTGTSDVYGYDSLYRLARYHEDPWTPLSSFPPNDGVDPIYWANPERTYGMDGVGNRTAIQNPAETYTLLGSDAVVNQYTEVRPASSIERPTWDGNGNLSRILELNLDGTFRSDIRYIHDYRNRLAGIRRLAADGTTVLSDVTYYHDPLGRRIAKEGGGTVGPFSRIVYISDGNQEIQERDPSGVLRREYVYGNGIDEPIRMLNAQTGQSFYYHTNSLGTVTALSNSAGLLAERYRYDVHGAPTDDAGNLVAAPSSVGNPFLFTARRLDVEETSALPSLRHRLYFYRARSYLPAWGRFIERDPLSPAPRFHLGAANPGNTRDPMGLWEASIHQAWEEEIARSQEHALQVNGRTGMAIGLAARYFDDSGGKMDPRNYLHGMSDEGEDEERAIARSHWTLDWTFNRAVGLAADWRASRNKYFCRGAVVALGLGDHTAQDIPAHRYITLGQHYGPEYLFGAMDIWGMVPLRPQAREESRQATIARHGAFIGRLYARGFQRADIDCCIRQAWEPSDPLSAWEPWAVGLEAELVPAHEAFARVVAGAPPPDRFREWRPPRDW